MEVNIPDIVREYQCSGCTNDGDGCYKQKTGSNLACEKHSIGTSILSANGIVKVLLGFPKGFNRLGVCNEIAINIFNTYEDMTQIWALDKFNVPVWKYVDLDGNVIIKGLSPRSMYPFIHIVMENCSDKIDCIEISESDSKSMD